MIVGVIGSSMELYDPGAYEMPTFAKDIVTIMIVAFLFCSHYPRNGCLIVTYITFIFVIFWQIIKGYGIVVTKVFFVDVHLFSVLFYVSKLVLDLTVIATGYRLV